MPMAFLKFKYLNMRKFKKYFKGKKVTVMGLGLLGRGVGDAAFLAECGAELTITDLKTKEQLKDSITKLKKFNPEGKQASYGAGNIKYILGKHRLEDFRDRDLILKAAGVPIDSIYIKEAEKNKIPVKMSASLFVELSNLPMIGVTGTRGKSTVTHLIARILESAGPRYAKGSGEASKRVILGGNVRGVSNLQLLKQARNKDFAVFELDSWQLQGFGEAKISPHISVFTNFMQDHLNYYKNNPEQYFTDKSYIYKFQRPSDVLILGPGMKNKIKSVKSEVVKASIKNIPKTWKILLAGKHNLENIACALEVARFLKIKEEIIRASVESFSPIEGRLQMVKKIHGVSIYNDNNSTTADAAIASLNSFSQKIILIMGGMDKGPEVNNLNKILSQKTKKIFLTPGSGSDRIKNEKADIEKVVNLEDAVNKSLEFAQKGDVILFSPGFASFNMFKNEYDRGDQFMKIVNNLK